MIEKIYQKNPNFVFRKIENEYILVPVEGTGQEMESIYTLENHTAVEVWELIDGKRSLKDIMEKLTQEYREADRENIQADVLKFILELESVKAINQMDKK